MALSWDQAEALYDRLAPAITGMVLTSTRRWADVEDQLHDALLAVARSGEVADPERYALRTAANALKRKGRQAWRWRPIEETSQLDERDALDPAAVVAEQNGRAELVRSQLSVDDQQVLELCVRQARTDTEAAEILGLRADAVRKRLERALARLREAWFEDAVGNSAGRGACRKALSWMMVDAAGNLGTNLKSQLATHLGGCEACRGRQRLLLQFRRREGLAALLPVPPAHAIVRSKPRVVARLVASLSKDAGAPEPRDRRRWVWRVGLALLLLFLLLPTQQMSPTVAPKTDVAGIHVAPSPAPANAESSSADASASPPAATAPASPRPTPPAYVSPCPPAAAGGYAYLHQGEVYYRSSIGSPATQVTSTGGHVDAFWWSPDGQSIAYKVPDAAPSIRGDVRMIRFGSGPVTWDLHRSVDFFSFSPTGGSWAAGTINVQNGVLQGVDVLVASFPSTAAQAATFTAADSDGSSGNPPAPVLFDWSGYQDRPPVLESSMRPDAGIFWTGAGIYEHLDGPANLYSPSGSYMSMRYVDAPLLGQFEGLPTSSAFTIAPSGEITRTCAGTVVPVYQPDLMGRATQMSVGGGGRIALICVHDGGWTMDVVRLYADGRRQYLSTDGATELPRWQP